MANKRKVTASAIKKKPRGRPFEKGKPRHPKAGRRKGTPNKVSQSVAHAIKEAFDALGGADGLVDWAQEDPANLTTFYQLAAKLIPQQVTGNNFGPLQTEDVTRDELSDKIMAAALQRRANGDARPGEAEEIPRITH